MPATYPRTTNRKYQTRRDLERMLGNMARIQVRAAGGTVIEVSGSRQYARSSVQMFNAREDEYAREHGTDAECLYVYVANHPDFIACYYNFRYKRPRIDIVNRFKVESLDFRTKGLLDDEGFSHKVRSRFDDNIGTVTNSFHGFAGARDFALESRTLDLYNVVPEAGRMDTYYGKSNVTEYFGNDERRYADAALGVQALELIGKKLDNWEIDMPIDWRLKHLEILGRTFFRFAERDVVFRGPQDPSNMLGTIREEDDKERYKAMMNGNQLFRTEKLSRDAEPHEIWKFSSIEDIWRRGLVRPGDDYINLADHVWPSEHLKTPYVPTSSDPDASHLFTKGANDNYEFVINPRALHVIDIRASGETLSKVPPQGKEHYLPDQKEVVYVNEVDPRDIRGAYKLNVTYEKVVVDGKEKRMKVISRGEFIQNPNYLPSSNEVFVPQQSGDVIFKEPEPNEK